MFSVLFFIGMAEEISWGQKLWHFSTPAKIAKLNVQREFNIHNLEPFNSRRLNGTNRTGWNRIFTVNFIYKLFWFGYGILLPIGFYGMRPVRTILRRIQLPIPPLALGILFVPNYLIMKIIGFLLQDKASFQALKTASEIYECGTALIFFAISIYFLKTQQRVVPHSRD